MIQKTMMDFDSPFVKKSKSGKGNTTNKYGIKVGDFFLEHGNTYANYYQVVKVSEGGAWVKLTRNKSSGGPHNMAIVPIKNEFRDNKPPVYKRVMKDRYSIEPIYYIKTSKYSEAHLVRGSPTAHITDSQFW